MRAPLVAATCALGLSIGAPSAYAAIIDAPTAIARLNAIRAANGIPANLVEDPQLSLGCRLHLRYIRTARNYSPHREIPGTRNATPLGALAASVSNLARGSFGERDLRLLLADPRRFPWDQAPLHLRNLLDPSATTAWFGADIGTHSGGGCMGANGDGGFHIADPWATPDPVFHSVPGNGARNVPFAMSVKGETPYNPAIRAGLKAEAMMGPIVYLFSSAAGSIAKVAVTGPEGPVATVRYARDPFVFFPKPLRPNATYQVQINWAIDAHFPGDPPKPPIQATQAFTFSTGTTAIVDDAVPQDPRMKLAVRRSGNRLRIVITAGEALGRTVPLQFSSRDFPHDTISFARKVRLSRPRTVVTQRLSPQIMSRGYVSVATGVELFRKAGIPYATRDVVMRVLTW